MSITRDEWGIAHVEGRSDADAVFGMIYAQAEDDFARIEANYLTALGRLAEAEGEKAIWQDLRARLYVSESELKAHYLRSPPWLKQLMDAWAAGLNHYLATNRQVRPRVIRRFEPWMALSFTEGSIGGDIEEIDLKALERFYSGQVRSGQARADQREHRGSNGIAIAPALTREGRPLLLINPHTSFYFRSEQQVTSSEGLNVYGAATWGQFFVYQGFNADAGWMHTSSGVDSIDEFAVDVRRSGGQASYRYGQQWRPLGQRPVSVRYRRKDGSFGERRFTTWRTHHGPVVRADGGRWVAFAMMDRPVEALQQSFLRTKAKNLQGFIEVARLAANSSNNTIFADRSGTIAYLHPQFVPRRDDRFDYLKAVDGSDPRTDWTSIHQISELPNVINPPNGWVQNTNSWPYSAAGPFSPERRRFPRYMDRFGENYRGLHALKLLSGSKGWTIDSLQAAAFDTHQPGFAELIPPLVAAWDASEDKRLKAKLAEPIAMLRAWDYRWSTESVPTTLAAFWAGRLWDEVRIPKTLLLRLTIDRMRALPPERKLKALEAVVDRLTGEFGTWRTPWGTVNRMQRISGAIDHPFSDSAPSLPVGFTSGRWGSLASFESEPRQGSKKWYGFRGNSFVAIVEFGPRVRARAIHVGGQSGDPASPHFNDQSARFAAGALRAVHFHPDEIARHAKRRYKPGERP